MNLISYLTDFRKRASTLSVKWTFNPNPSGFMYTADQQYLETDHAAYDFDKHIPVFDTIHQAILFLKSIHWVSFFRLHMFLCFGNKQDGRVDKYTNHGLRMYAREFSLWSVDLTDVLRQYIDFISRSIEENISLIEFRTGANPQPPTSSDAMELLRALRRKEEVNNPLLWLGALASENTDDYVSPQARENWLYEHILPLLYWSPSLYINSGKAFLKFLIPNSKLWVANHVSRWTNTAVERFGKYGNKNS